MAKTKYLRLVILYSVVGLCFYIVLNYCYRARYVLSIKKQVLWQEFEISKVSGQNQSHKQVADIKTILLWTPPNCWDCKPFPAFKHGNLIFQKHDCEYQNCYIMPSDNNISDILNPENYDAVVFNGRTILRMRSDDFPKRRRKEQIYIFLQLEAAARFPVCNSYFDDFFNWTLTHRLNSDIPWTYFEVKTKNNVSVAPSENIKWMVNNGDESVTLNDEELETKLRQKTKFAAWFVSNCVSGNSQRLQFVKKLNKELKRYYAVV